MRIFVPKESVAGESRISVLPVTVAKLIKLGAEVEIETGLGESLWISDGEYRAVGGTVATERAPAGTLGAVEKDWAAVLKHAKIPVISYPYEWPFGMLKDAALLHLKLMLSALDAGMILKDSSAYNIPFAGAAPVFIDIPSFEVLSPGEPWIGYRQFCELFLYPLMLQAYKGVDYRPWLRGNIDGVPAEVDGPRPPRRSGWGPARLLYGVSTCSERRARGCSREHSGVRLVLEPRCRGSFAGRSASTALHRE